MRLQLEDGTGGREGETENDWKLEMGKCELEDGPGRRKEATEKTTEGWKWESLNWLQKMQKTRATGDCNGALEAPVSLFLGGWV